MHNPIRYLLLLGLSLCRSRIWVPADHFQGGTCFIFGQRCCYTFHVYDMKLTRKIYDFCASLVDLSARNEFRLE